MNPAAIQKKWWSVPITSLGMISSNKSTGPGPWRKKGVVRMKNNNISSDKLFVRAQSTSLNSTKEADLVLKEMTEEAMVQFVRLEKRDKRAGGDGKMVKP
ncbi:hypothetical protein RIF29_13878 [Crotalaria pallida]|uniref:Uncharacterized protein n=1 Tax=Crotalaria pallida TaxID=3830 RepID=A0AAN9FJ25_CROPI